jgi:1,4-dihydroxy-6-naphthoate synthase
LKLTLGFSPCPNDTFIFDAMVNGKIDCGDLEFEVVLEDVETLNQMALEGILDITKLSFPALFQSSDKYELLDSGGALGKGVGPILISRQNDPSIDLTGKSIALPGEHTTANLLFSFAYPHATNKKFMLFSAIEDAVLHGETELGVIIHENRFTYQQKGLFKVMDLGDYWEKQMNTPIPLGAIAVHKRINGQIAHRIEGYIRRSIEHAFANLPEIPEYVKTHSATLSEDVMRQHIDLYVNDFSLSYGLEGNHAIARLREAASC